MVRRPVRPVKEFVQARGAGPRFHRGSCTVVVRASDLVVFRFSGRGRHAVPLTPCRSAPSTPTSTSPPWRSARWPAGASARSSRRPARLRKGGEPWIFYEGPPTANGRPGLHHVWARAFKDLFPRFQTMRGRDVPRKGGWDCHGLPVELEVEKELGLAQQARDRGLRHRGVQPALPRVGAPLRRGLVVAHQPQRRVDRHRRRLLDAGQRLHRVGLVAHAPAVGQGPALRGPPGHALLRPVRHRPSARTRWPRATRTSSTRRSTCASRCAGDGAPDADLLVWTTTPWTLISNVAAAVGPDVRLRAGRRPRRRPRPGAGRAGRGRACTPRPRSSTRWTGADMARRLALPAPVRVPRAGRGQGGLAGGGGRLRHRRRRLRHRPPRPRLRRGRRPGGPRRGPARPQPGRRRRHVRPPGPAVERAVRQGRRPRDHRRPARPGPARGRAALRAQLPPLLAVRHAAHLLGQDVVVRPHRGEARRPARPERGDRLVPRPHQARPVRALARGQHRLGAVARPLLGHAAADLAVPRLRRATRASGRWPSCPSWRGATCPTSTCTGPTSTR